MSHKKPRWDWNWKANNLFRESRNELILSESWLHIICITFHFVFFADNFRKCATLNAILWRNFQATYFFWIKVGVFFKRNSFIRVLMRHSVLFILVSYSSSLCHATWFSFAIRHSFLKEWAIAKTAKYIWTWIRTANSFTAINIINNSGTWFALYAIRESN